VGSAQATFIVLLGIFTGPMVDAGYVRPLMIVGCFLTVFGMMMTSLATSYYQVCHVFFDLFYGLMLMENDRSSLPKAFA
jgi:hypothetical protein